MTRSKPRDSVPTPVHDPIALWCTDVVGLFAGPLGEVRFPDIDDATLAASADAVRHAQLEVEALERALDDARARTHAANAALADLCDRALAYARVFASTRPELQDVIATVRTPSDKPGPGLTPKKRGRPRKDSATVELLPDDAIAPH